MKRRSLVFIIGRFFTIPIYKTLFRYKVVGKKNLPKKGAYIVCSNHLSNYSVWFPGFVEYMRENRIRTDAVYLSLGDREEKTRNTVMAAVGVKIRVAYTLLKDQGINTTLEWNQGNHFRDADIRTAKAYAWLMKK